jgi:hypothetical protein
MKSKTINYSVTFEMGSQYGQKVWEKIGQDAEMEEGDTFIECYRNLREQINAAHAETVAEIELYRGTKVITVEQKPIDSIQSTIDELNKCLTIEELKTYWLPCKGNLVLSGAYKSRQKQLEDANTK